MNNKGFTLTELLVTIAVMAIIIGIAFPAISNLKGQNGNKKYEAYEQVMLNGAKIYYDSNKEDLDNECYILTKTYLVNQKLINDYKESNSETLDGSIIIKKAAYGTVNYYINVNVTKGNNELYNKVSGITGCKLIN